MNSSVTDFLIDTAGTSGAAGASTAGGVPSPDRL